jgi:hypothetical protein
MARKDSISQYGQDKIGIEVFENNVDTDPIGDVLLDVKRDGDQVLVIDDAIATHDGVGLFSYDIGYEITAERGDYTVTWSYQVDTGSGPIDRTFAYSFTVTYPQPHWDSLNNKQKGVVENIYFKLSDGFDSTIGGPYLWELPQSNFGYETIARLTMVDGMNLINFEGPKAFQAPYAFGGTTGRQIPEGWYGLVQKAGFYETLKHLSRSYLEIPQEVNVPVAYLDRTRYSDMWMRMADKEGEELLRQIHMIKRAMAFGVRTRSLSIAGGIFPISYLNPARPRWPYVLTRFY